MKKLRRYIKICRKAGLKDNAIKNHLLSYNTPEKIVDASFKKLELYKKIRVWLVFLALIFMISMFAFNPQFIGFVTQNQSTVYTDDVQLSVTETSQATWVPEHTGEIFSILASGRIIGSGQVKVYMVIGSTRYLVLDSNALKQKQVPLITGLVIGNETEEITTIQNPEIPQTEEPTAGERPAKENNTAETPAKNETITTKINETISLENNETIVENNNETIINETLSLENNSSEIINETITENNNETLNKNNETVTEEINSEINETTTNISESTAPTIIEFENICEETCELREIAADSYTLEFEIEGDARIIIDNLKYSAKKKQI